MSWGDGITTGIKGAAASGPAMLPEFANAALFALVGMAYDALVPSGVAAAGLRLKLAKLHIELAANSDLSHQTGPGVVLSNLVEQFRPGTIENGPGQTMSPGSSVGGYNPMPPMSYEAPRAPLAKRAGDALEEATRWAESNAASIELFSDLRPGVGALWSKVEDAATAAGVAAGESAGAIMDPMRAELGAVVESARRFARWAAVGAVAFAGAWLFTKTRKRKGEPWES